MVWSIIWAMLIVSTLTCMLCDIFRVDNETKERE